jgi:transposase
MKEGLLGGTLSVSPRSQLEEARLHVAPCTGSESKKRMGADRRYIPLLVTAPEFGWIKAFTVASEIGDVGRFASPAKLSGYTGLCSRVRQSGSTDRRGRSLTSRVVSTPSAGTGV